MEKKTFSETISTMSSKEIKDEKKYMYLTGNKEDEELKNPEFILELVNYEMK